MRAREEARFRSMNFTDEEIEIRNKLYKARKNARYKMIITTEHYDMNKRKHLNEVDPDGKLGYTNGYLAYFTDYPEDGTYLDTVYFRYPYEYKMVIQLYEGQFYQLFDMETGERIGYGNLDPDSPVEEIRATNRECCDVCDMCFWTGLLYNEDDYFDAPGKDYVYATCYHPVMRKEWIRAYMSER